MRLVGRAVLCNTNKCGKGLERQKALRRIRGIIIPIESREDLIPFEMT